MRHFLKSFFPLILISFLAIISMTQTLMINITPSMPLGIYVKSYEPIQRGDTVVACLSEPYKSRGLNAGYLHYSSHCQGSTPVIKEVVAVPGDDVILQDEWITVNNKRFHNVTLNKDTHGNKIAYYPRGKYLNTTRYWLIGTNDINHSWDSRYWGPLDPAQLSFKIKPLWLAKDTRAFK